MNPPPSFSAVPYDGSMALEWDRFVEDSKNATFLHFRSFMDHHSDRFPDRSLTLWRNGRLYALFPATARPGDRTVTSHAGLTFASMLAGQSATAADSLLAFRAISDHYRREGFETLVCRPVPHIHHSIPAEEELFALFRMGAKLSGRSVGCAIPLDARMPWRRIRLCGLNRAIRENFTVTEEKSPEPFWPLLENVLADRHGARPVHSLEEILLLSERFPSNIRTFTVRTPKEEKPVAGTVIFCDRGVARTQYIAANPSGRALGALDFLFHRLLSDVFSSQRWFDFGTSNKPDGSLNEPLIYQKEGFGARTVCHDTYTLAL